MPRRAKPTKQKKLEGNPGKRELNQADLNYNKKTTRPRWLKGKAKSEWERLGKELRIMGLLTPLDRNAFTRYCDMFGKWYELAEILSKSGITYERPILDKDRKEIGTKTEYKPEYKAFVELNKELMRLESEFGLTPASRGKINFEPGDTSKKGESVKDLL